MHVYMRVCVKNMVPCQDGIALPSGDKLFLFVLPWPPSPPPKYRNTIIFDRIMIILIQLMTKTIMITVIIIPQYPLDLTVLYYRDSHHF